MFNGKDVIIYFGKELLQAPSIIFTCQQGNRCEGTRMQITYSKKQVSQIAQELFTSWRSHSKLLSFGMSEVTNKSILQNNVDHKL